MTGYLTDSLSMLYYCLALSCIIFCIGIVGVVANRKNLISIFMSIELMLLAVNINFVAFSTYMNNYMGQVFTIFILTVAAAEAAIGLAILVVYNRNKGDIEISEMNNI